MTPALAFYLVVILGLVASVAAYFAGCSEGYRRALAMLRPPGQAPGSPPPDTRAGTGAEDVGHRLLFPGGPGRG